MKSSHIAPADRPTPSPRRRPWLALGCACLALGLVGYRLFASRVAAGGHVPRTHIRVGVLPQGSPESLECRNSGLVAFLSKECGISFEEIVAPNNEALVQGLVSGEYDIAFMDAHTSILALKRGVLPLVLRDVDRRTTSVLVAAATNDRETLEGFRGARLAFGDLRSSSGHVMPRCFLEQAGIIPESHFADVRFIEGGHAATIRALLENKVDLIAVSAASIAQRIERGELKRADIKIIWQTPPYVGHVWAISPNLPVAWRRSLRDAFLELQRTDPAHAVTLDELETDGFLPAAQEDCELHFELFGQHNRRAEWNSVP
jgi:phosphonate transport system substrate-binding protein